MRNVRGTGPARHARHEAGHVKAAIDVGTGARMAQHQYGIDPDEDLRVGLRPVIGIDEPPGQGCCGAEGDCLRAGPGAGDVEPCGQVPLAVIEDDCPRFVRIQARDVERVSPHRGHRVIR